MLSNMDRCSDPLSPRTGHSVIRYEALKGLELSQSKDDNHAKFNLLTNHVFLLASIVSLNKVSFSGKL